MMSDQRIYETVYVLHPEMSDEDVETNVQNTVSLLENHGASIIRTERGGKRRLAYPIEKQRYGYYNLIHYHGTNMALSEMERMFRLSDRVLRYLTVRFDKEEHLTSLTRMGDDDGRDDDRDARRRGDRGRRGDRVFGRGPRRFEDRNRDREPIRHRVAAAPMDTDDDDDLPDDEMESLEELD
jgi:small subunit ribosomal protein S6